MGLKSDTSMNADNRQTMDVDIVCVGFGPASAGFLHTLSKGLLNSDGTPAVESRVMPGMPLQVICYERADGLAFGVSGVVTRGAGIKRSFPDLDVTQIPLAAHVKEEKLVYLLDPHNASRRPLLLKIKDQAIKLLKGVLPFRDWGFEFPFIPPFLSKDEGLVFSLGQFNQWIGSEIMGSGLAQIWPGMPVAEPLFEGSRVKGVRLVDQGTDLRGTPTDCYMPGMDIHAALTVVADGPVGPVGAALDEKFGLPEGHHKHDWAVGAKFVVSLPEDCPLEPGTVLHTFGYPEPEIFGFLYVYPERTASLGIFVPSTFANPARTSYRYLQLWMKHPYLWRWLEGAELRSWGAKSLQESGKLGEPFLVGDGYARIGEGSGTTNMLTGSGVDEAWTSGVLLAEAVLELGKAGKDFTKENLDAAYAARRRASALDKELQAAEKARNGFHYGMIPGLLGMAITGFSKGRFGFPGKNVPPHKQLTSLEEFYRGRIEPAELESIKKEAKSQGVPLHEKLLARAGFPEIEFDGKLLMSQQDALLKGGKVQAPGGYADHVAFSHPEICERCGDKLCIEVCSGQAITHGEKGVPAFDREKCVHCGACLWNCTKPLPENEEKMNIVFRAGAGGLHSVEN